MEVDYEGFSIREYTKNVRSVEVRRCWPFAGAITGDRIQSLLPPITIAKFRWWSHELASLLAKSPVAADDSDPVFRRKATKAKSKPCKKRSIVEIFAAAPQIQLAHREEDDGDDSDVLISSKRKRMKNLVAQKTIKSKKSKDSGDRKFQNKVNKCKQEAREKVDVDGKFSLGIKESSHGVTMSLSRKKAGSVSKEQDSEFQIPSILKAKRKVCSVRTPDKSKIYAPQCERHARFSDLEFCCLEMNRLSLSSPEDQSSVNDKIMSNHRTSDNMRLECRQQQRKVQPVISEISHSPMSQPPASPLDPLLMEWMQKSVLYRQMHVEEAVSVFPLNLQGELVEANGEGCTSFDRSGLGTAYAENDLLLGNFSIEKKHSAEPTLAKDGVRNEKRHKYFPARLGIDETFTENNDGECGQTVHSPVSSLNPRSHRINLSKQDGLNQNLNSRNMFANRDCLCLHNTQATMRLMGKDVSVGSSYSDMVRTRERIIATPDASIDCSFLGSYTHSTAALDKNWNRTLLQDTSKELFRRFCEPHVVIHESEFPPIVLNPCCSLTSFPLPDKDLSFHGSGLVQQQHQLPFPSNYNNLDMALLHDARNPSFGLACTDSTRQSQAPWPQSSFENSPSGMSEQLLSKSSLHKSKSLKR